MEERRPGVGGGENRAFSPEEHKADVDAMAQAMRDLYQDPKTRLALAMSLAGVGSITAESDVTGRPVEASSVYLIMEATETLIHSADPVDKEIGRAALLQMFDVYTNERMARLAERRIFR